MTTGRALLVTGTDTGVGKTLVTAALATALADLGLSVRAIKPIESGTTSAQPGDDEDGVILARATGQNEPRQALMRLREPLAPPVAAEREGVTIDFDRLLELTSRLTQQAQLTLIEGAGGLLSPLSWSSTALDIATRLGARAIVVAADVLGSINHVRLTVRTLAAADVEIAAVVLSAAAHPDRSTGINSVALARLIPRVPIIDLPRVDSVRRAASHLSELARCVAA